MPALPFQRLIHCDWSVAAGKRWQADAERTGAGWLVSAPCPVGPLDRFVAELVRPTNSLLAGFDLPIGLPDAIGAGTGASGFRALLPQLGRPGRWADFYRVNDGPGEIALERPFYPNRWSAGVTSHALLDGLGVASLDALRRRCERRRPGRRAATPLFWTVGPAQVGKAAISGWRDVLTPALAGGARLWPFDGPLDQLAAGGTVFCETYPGEMYAHVGVRFAPRQSKRRQGDRRNVAAGLAARCAHHGIAWVPALREQVRDGFGPAASGEDAFDALIGLLGMIEVADGRRAAGPNEPALARWEGWILGQDAAEMPMEVTA